MTYFNSFLSYFLTLSPILEGNNINPKNGFIFFLFWHRYVSWQGTKEKSVFKGFKSTDQ